MTNEIDKQLDNKEKALRKKIKKKVEEKKYQDKITPIQQKFIENYTTRYGQWSATQCAIAAGYSSSSAHTRAAELLDWKKHPDIAIEIQDRLAALQCTGKNNYSQFAADMDLPEVMKDPDLMASKFPMESAIWFFHRNKLWNICDEGVNDDTIKRLTKRINGGYNGLKHRKEETKKIYE